MSAKKAVLFICTRNSARSQMAEALLRHHFGDRYEAMSAGTEPGEVHPMALRVLRERGVDTAGLRSKGAAEFLEAELDLVVTLCNTAKASCPFFPGGKRQMHKGFRDPLDLVREGMEPPEAFGRVRDDIERWVIGYFAGEPGGTDAAF